MRTSTVEFYVDAGGFHRWRLRAANGRIVAQGEGHTSERDARRAFRSMQAAAKAPRER